MIPWLPIAIASGALAALGTNKRKGRARRLRGVGKAPLRARLARLDARYQASIQRHIDPLLMGRKRAGQLAALSAGQLRLLSPAEEQANRALLLGAGALGLIVVGALSGWPLTPLVIALGLYNLLPMLRESWRVATQGRRFSIMHLLLFYLASLWLGGYYLVGVIGVVFSGVAQKLELLTQMRPYVDGTYIMPSFGRYEQSAELVRRVRAELAEARA